MPIPDLETPFHHCVKTIEQVFSSRLDLKDGPCSILMLNGLQMEVALWIRDSGGLGIDCELIRHH